MRSPLLLSLLIGLLLAAPATASGVPEPLGDTLNDYAALLTTEAAAGVVEAADALYVAHGVPVVVVTVKSMGTYPEVHQEDFILFSAEWSESWVFESDEAAARAIFLFVSQEDRTARIALGDGYPDTAKPAIQQVLLDHLVPHLKKDEWSLGISESAKALIAMAGVIAKQQKWTVVASE